VGSGLWRGDGRGTRTAAPDGRAGDAHHAELTGRDVTNLPYYLCFATFKLAVILQQIYYRFNQGLTRDERFGPLIDMVKLLVRVAREQKERDTI
jgi:aminoglycoside phosphotransferase (APT) family kinase protein